MKRQRPALDLLADLQQGRVAARLSEQLHELIAACLDTGKKGVIQLQLVITPDPNAPQERMNVDARTVVKAPVRSERASLFFVSAEGNLQRTDPNAEAHQPLMALPDDDEVDDRKKAN